MKNNIPHETVLDLRKKGFSKNQIAEKVGITPKDVETIYRKYLENAHELKKKTALLQIDEKLLERLEGLSRLYDKAGLTVANIVHLFLWKAIEEEIMKGLNNNTEKQIISLRRKGLTIPEIAEKCGISSCSAVRSILRKVEGKSEDDTRVQVSFRIDRELFEEIDRVEEHYNKIGLTKGDIINLFLWAGVEKFERDGRLDIELKKKAG